MYIAYNKKSHEALFSDDFKVIYGAVLHNTHLWPEYKDAWHCYRSCGHDLGDAILGKLPEIQWDPKKCFHRGNVLEMPGLYGTSYDVQVIGRTEDRIFVRDCAVIPYEVHRDEEGVEYIVAWEYRGYRACVKANQEV